MFTTLNSGKELANIRYVFFVRAWFADNVYAVYRSDGIIPDISPPRMKSQFAVRVRISHVIINDHHRIVFRVILCIVDQYGTLCKRPENRVHSKNSAIHKIMHLGPIVVHFLSTCDCLGFYT